jgi:hypothetical protein
VTLRELRERRTTKVSAADPDVVDGCEYDLGGVAVGIGEMVTVLAIIGLAMNGRFDGGAPLLNENEKARA